MLVCFRIVLIFLMFMLELVMIEMWLVDCCMIVVIRLVFCLVVFV